MKKIINFNNFLEEARALRWLFCSNITKYQERIPGNCHCVHTRLINVFSRAAQESFKSLCAAGPRQCHPTATLLITTRCCRLCGRHSVCMIGSSCSNIKVINTKRSLSVWLLFIFRVSTTICHRLI